MVLTETKIQLLLQCGEVMKFPPVNPHHILYTFETSWIQTSVQSTILFSTSTDTDCVMQNSLVN